MPAHRLPRTGLDKLILLLLLLLLRSLYK